VRPLARYRREHSRHVVAARGRFAFERTGR
jgi:hypothetical protein